MHMPAPTTITKHARAHHDYVKIHERIPERYALPQAPRRTGKAGSVCPTGNAYCKHRDGACALSEVESEVE